MRIGTSEVLDHSNSTMSFSKSQGIKKFILYSAIIVMAPILALLFSAVSEAAGPWKGQIVEKETGKPLEDVVVLAVWYTAYSTLGGWGSGGYHDSEEVVTDVNGRFLIRSKQTWTLNPFKTIKGPEILIFKSGFGRWQFRGQDSWSKDALESEEKRRQAWQQFEGKGIIFEIPKLEDLQKRREWIGRAEPSGDIPSERVLNYLFEIDKERAVLGFEPLRRGRS